jgi:hypothetical protein
MKALVLHCSLRPLLLASPVYVNDERGGQELDRLLEAVRRRRYLRPTLFSLLIFKIQQGAWQQAADSGSLDYAFWKGQGWFEPRRTFFFDQRSGPLKVALARVAGALVARFDPRWRPASPQAQGSFLQTEHPDLRAALARRADGLVEENDLADDSPAAG